MRVLVVHNRYSSRVPSGENLAVDDEVRWLREAGLGVETFEMSNDDVFGARPGARIRQAAESLWSLSAQRKLSAAVERTKPDIVHVHNLFPLLTASAASAGVRSGRPVVWTVHNHRVACVAGTYFRDGQPCHDCRPGWRLPGVRHRCYGDSMAASALVTAATSAFGRLARRELTAVAISGAVRDWLVDVVGVPDDRAFVRYNAVAGPDAALTLRPAAEATTFLFVGHLSEHKGVGLLLDAWQRAELPPDVRLQVVGDGPLATAVRAAAAADRRIGWAGQLAPSDVTPLLADARAVVVPSVWDEPFGRAAAEGLAYHRPVITTGTGGLAEIVTPGCGWVTGTDPDAVARAMEEAATSPDAVARRSAAADRRYRELFSPEASVDALVRIYERAIAPGGSGPPAASPTSPASPTSSAPSGGAR